MYRILVAEFAHETNTFSNQKTDKKIFKERSFIFEEEVFAKYKNTGTELGAFFTVLSAEPEVDLIAVVAASASPGGPVCSDVFNEVSRSLVSAVEKHAPVDLILLSLHGAMVTEMSGDGEGDLLELIREQAGPAVPIVVTLDLHANVSEKMVANADVLITYEDYPHIDAYDRGIEGAKIALRILRGEIRPQMRAVHLPQIIPALTTKHPAMQKIVERVRDYKKKDGVLSVSFAHGFHLADTPVLGATLIAVTDGDLELATKIVEDLAQLVWTSRASLVHETLTPAAALAEAAAIEGGPVVFADVADNPGGGSACDGTHLLRFLLEHKVKDAALALIVDPESVKHVFVAGVGQTVELKLGGKVNPAVLGEPLKCRAYVRLLFDGNYKNRGLMSRGVAVTLGRSAVIVIDGIQIIITEHRTQPYDTEIFYAHGIDPTRQKLLIVKSTHHYKAAFEPLARKILPVEVSGVMPQNPCEISYRHLRRPIYPLDGLANWRN